MSKIIFFYTNHNNQNPGKFCVSSLGSISHLGDSVISAVEGEGGLQFLPALQIHPSWSVVVQAIYHLAYLFCILPSREVTWSQACRAPCGIADLFLP